MEQYQIDDLKTNLRSYLESQGINTSRLFRCINPHHIEKNASMKYYDDNKVHCFGCGMTYNLFDVISICENCDNKEAFKKAIQYYGYDNLTPQKKLEQVQKTEPKEPETEKDYRKAFVYWNKRLRNNQEAQKYLFSRGIDMKTANRFNLGFNYFNIGEFKLNAIIIPTSDNSYTARNIKDGELRYYRKTKCHTRIFNTAALKNKIPYCVITEGEFDCLSFETVGVNCIALGSANNLAKFIECDKDKNKTYILALDNDNAGKVATNEFIQYFNENHILYLTFDNCGFKDANQALVENKPLFTKRINQIVETLTETEHSKKINAEMWGIMQQTFFDLLGEDFEHFKSKESNDWHWTLKDYPKQNNGLKVFSCFACGGGSTMGYKLAGYEVIGDLEIDKRMNDIYLKNHNPKYNFVMDIRDFNSMSNEDLPPELFDLDILDGSPPCTTFSMAGKREQTWGKKKKFREGQKEQTLDDLSFIFIETVNKLKPKFVVMENVEGMTKGNAWKYVQRIYKHFHDIGYTVKHWLLKGENMGVPQKRHRIFFIATRLNINLDQLDLSFNYNPVPFGKIKSKDSCNELTPTLKELITHAKYGERNLENACFRLRGKGSFFNYCFVYDDEVAPTITAHCNNIRWDNKCFLSKQDIISISTFPQDYDFINNNFDNVAYVCGMSVPPVMIKRVAERLQTFLLKEKNDD